MDLLYLIGYQNWTFPLSNNTTFCKPGSSEGETVTGADLSARVAFNASDADYYREQFDVKEVSIINPALKKYRDLYLRMSELNCQLPRQLHDVLSVQLRQSGYWDQRDVTLDSVQLDRCGADACQGLCCVQRRWA